MERLSCLARPGERGLNRPVSSGLKRIGPDPRAPPPQAGSRTRAKARVVLLKPREQPEEIATPTRRFSSWDVTSGLPDDTREEGDWRAGARLRYLRGRVKAARAAVPGVVDVLVHD